MRWSEILPEHEGIRRLLIVVSVTYWVAAAGFTTSVCLTTLCDRDAVSDEANRIWWAPKHITPPPHGYYPAGWNGQPDPAYEAIVTRLERNRAIDLGLLELWKWSTAYIAALAVGIAALWVYRGFKADRSAK